MVISTHNHTLEEGFTMPNNFMNYFLIAGPVLLLLGLLFALPIFKKNTVNKKLVDIAKAYHESQKAFSDRQIITYAAASILIFVAVLYALTWQIAVGFLFGSLFSLLLFLSQFAIKIKVLIKSLSGKSVEKKAAVFSLLFALGLSLVALSGFQWIFQNTDAFFGMVFGVIIGNFLLGVVADQFSTAAKNIEDEIAESYPHLRIEDWKNPSALINKLGGLAKRSSVYNVFFALFAVLMASGISLSHLLTFKNGGVFLWVIITLLALVTLLLASLVDGEKSKKLGEHFSSYVSVISSFLLLVIFIDRFGEGHKLYDLEWKKLFLYAGLVLVALLYYLVLGLTKLNQNKAASMAISEIKNQFATTFGVLEGKTKPNYEKPVDLSLKFLLQGHLLSSIVICLLPSFIGLTMGVVALKGFSIGLVVLGIILLIFSPRNPLLYLPSLAGIVSLLVAVALAGITLSLQWRIIFGAIAIIALMALLIFSGKFKFNLPKLKISRPKRKTQKKLKKTKKNEK